MQACGGQFLACAALAHKQHWPVHLGHARKLLLKGEKGLGLAECFGKSGMSGDEGIAAHVGFRPCFGGFYQ